MNRKAYWIIGAIISSSIISAIFKASDLRRQKEDEELVKKSTDDLMQSVINDLTKPND